MFANPPWDRGPMRIPPGLSRRSGRAGFSLIEVVFSTLLVSVVMLGAMNMLGAVVNGRADAADRSRAQTLAQQLLTEVLRLPYEDPQLGGGTLGPESGEPVSNRSAWDDVDDYHDWTSSPPQDSAGTAFAELSGWTRRVTVDYVSRSTPTTTAASDQGLKRIRIRVERSGTVLGEAWGLKGKL